MRWFILPLLFAFAACEPGTATGPSSSAPPVAQASLKVETESDTPYAIAENILLHTEGDHLVLEVNGQAIALTAGQAYLAGQALSRGGFELMDPKLADAVTKPRKPGPRCHEGPQGGYGVVVNGWIFAGGGCPPPPPPDFLELDLLRGLLGNAPAEFIEIPGNLEWQDLPGGYGAPLDGFGGLKF